MKFGLSLEKGIESKFRDWGSYAVKYNAMKQFLVQDEEVGDDASELGKGEGPDINANYRNQSLGEDAGEEKAENFWTVYKKSLSSIEGFYEEKVAFCKTKLKDHQDQVKTLRLSILQIPEAERKRILGSSAYESIKQSLKEFRDEIDLILEFLEINKTACRKILKKYDKRRACSILDVSMTKLEVSHNFLFGGGLIADDKRKVENMLQKLESLESTTSISGDQIVSPYAKLSKQVLDKAQSILDEIDQSPMFLSNKVRPNPIFEREGK